MLGAWDVQQLLDRKYRIQEEDNRIRQQGVVNAGLLQGAQARNLDVTSGLAPGLAKAEIGERGARSYGLTTDADNNTRITSSNIDRNRADIRATDAGIPLTMAQTAVARANIPLIGAQVGQTRAQTGAITDMSVSNRKAFGLGGGMPAVDMPAVPAPTALPTAPRKRPTSLQQSLRPTFARGLTSSSF
jgi:hypothetical protein